MPVNGLGNCQSIGSHLCKRPGQVGRVSIHHGDRVGVLTSELVDGEAQDRIGGRASRHIGDTREADRPVGHIRCEELSKQTARIAHPDVSRQRSSVSHDHIGEGHVATDQTAGSMAIDGLGDRHRIGRQVGDSPAHGGGIAENNIHRVAIGARALTRCPSDAKIGRGTVGETRHI